ncbi:MAG: hypothetical protein SGPRY_013667 [Prymnesium sp.]
MAAPRVAIVGAGLAGSLCALRCSQLGMRCVIFDASPRAAGGRLGGGFHPDSGAAFVRATSPSFSRVLATLQEMGVVAEWRGRFGVLGTRGGGFLPLQALHTSQALPSNLSALRGSEDFCNFASGGGVSAYVGTPSNASICPAICRASGAELRLGARISAARCGEDGWELESIVDPSHPSHPSHPSPPSDPSQPTDRTRFDALVLASHDASFAARVVQSLPSEPSHASHLSHLAQALQSQRDEQTTPVFSLSAIFPAASLSSTLPFDAVSVPGSSHLSFLCRHASKPKRTDAAAGELWSAVSTPSLAKQVLEDAGRVEGDSRRLVEAAAAAALVQELRYLCRPFYGGDLAAVPQPLEAHAKRWGAGFAAKTLGLQEDSIGLEPWRLVVGNS